MNTMLKRILSLLLCFVLVVGYVPANAFAAENDETIVTETTEPSTEATEPSAEATDPSTEATEPSSEATEPSTEATEPSTEATEPSAETTVPVTEETVPATTEEEQISRTMEISPRAATYTVPAEYAAQGYKVVDTAVIFTDLHTSNGKYKDTEIGRVMGAVASTGLKVSSVTSGGDAFSVNEDNSSSNGPYTGKTATITASIQNYLGDSSIPVNYVWSDHDRYAVQADGKTLLDKTSRVVFSNNNYYVYALSMGDLCSYDRYVAGFNYTANNHAAREAAGFTPTVEEAIANFKADVKKMDKTRPLLIVSHQPLFDNRNDNAHAKAWFDAINEVAESMDVFFFFGHNHKYDNSSDYYYGKKSTMPVALPKSIYGTDWDYQYDTGAGYQGYLPNINLTSSNETLNFTHLCGGYMDPHTTGSYKDTTTRQNTVMMVVLLRNDAGEEIVNLVTVGAGDEYKADMYPQNVIVESAHEKETTDPTDPDPSEPTQPEPPAAGELSQGGVTVKVPGLTGLTVATVEKPAALEGIFGADAVAYDISVEGFDNYSGIASVTVPVTGENAENFAVFHVDGDKLVQMPGALSADGKSYTFTTAHFSVFVGGSIVAGAQLSGSYAEKQGAMPASKASTTTTNATAINSGSYYALYNRTAGRDLSATPSGNRLSFDTTNDYNAWYITSADDSFFVQAGGPNGQYLTIGNGTAGLSDTPTALKLGLTAYSSYGQRYTVWDIASGNYHLNNYQGDDEVAAGYKNGASSDRGSGWYLYPMTLGTPGATVTFKLQNAADMVLGGAATQNLTYEVTMGNTAVTNAAITWSSDKESVATVENGVVTAVGKGTATITATLTQVNGNKLSSNIVLTTTVTVAEKAVKDIVVPESITVYVGDASTTKVGNVKVIYEDDTEEIVSLTLAMLDDTINTETTGEYSTSITIGEITKNVTVKVNEKIVNNYPEYPHEGAVKVSKTGTGIDFQSTGLAQIEVSASGVPLKKGADVIVMLDTSSSMTKNEVTGSDGKKRSQVLEESLKNLIAYFKTPGSDGELLDLRVAIADFNGYYGDGSGGTSGTPYDRTSGDYVKNGTSNGSGYRQPSEAKVYTGNGELNAGAFVEAKNLAATYTLNYTSGTNYDYAFDAIYQLGAAIKAQNTEERDLYVIFMSDGASLQWNYFGTENTYTKWNNWLAGTWKASDLTTTNLNSTTHSYFYDLNDHDNDGHLNEHRMANAIKGDPNQRFEIIRKSTAGLPSGTLVSAGKDYLYTVPGLGATMFTINFDAKKDGNITVDNIDKALASTASDQTGSTKYYYKVTTAAELGHAFDAIGSEIAYAASNARFVDQMGDHFDLKMGALTDLDGNSIGIDNKIEIRSYSIWTRQDYLDNKCTENMIGARKTDANGNPVYTVLETVTFNADGTAVYSDKIGGGATNILADGTQEGYTKGVIYAQTFLYNTNVQGVPVNGVSIPTGKNESNLTTGSTNVLPSETFYWKLGTVQTSELAMRYYVYLEGSMEGTKPEGSYATNNFATLYYDNYVGKPCYKETVSPVLAWKQANISYAFYLVNENGQIIVNQTTGQTGSFANKIAVTNPVVYTEKLLNSKETVLLAVEAAEDDVLPKYYSLYDPDSSYGITIESDGGGAWNITQGAGKVASTYVTNFGTNVQFSNEASMKDGGVDYTHTVVWFAVLWNPQAHPDTVVIDYGLPVDISVLSNDMFGENGKLDSIGAYSSSLNLSGHDIILASGFGAEYVGTYGKAQANPATGKVRYTLNKSNGMQMSTYEQFAYAVHYQGEKNPGYYYDTITVIPATTIYYEDSFLDFKAYTYAEAQSIEENGTYYLKNSGGTYSPAVPVEGDGKTYYEIVETNRWQNEGTAVEGALQGEDRPGKYSLNDANNIYGYDNVNKGMSTFSLGTAKKVTVDADHYATAEFTFTGTGFDVVGMTSSDTGLMVVQVYDEAGNVRVKTVDTYYGVSYMLCNMEYRYVGKDEDDKNIWVPYVVSPAPDATGEIIPELDLDGSHFVGEKKYGIEYHWIATPGDNALYQVPVIEFADLPYGQYRVVLTATYVHVLNNGNNDMYNPYEDTDYDLYVDAIRIYDPANDGAEDNDTVIEDAYRQDGEGWPSYIELRNKLINAETLGNNDTSTKVEGLVFIDGNAALGEEKLGDYTSYGPNNEVYLAPGQRVAFLLSNVNDNVAGIHIGIKSADGNKGTYTITNIAKADSTDNKVKAGDYYNARTFSMDTTTDMYYDMTSWKNDIIVISNTGNREENNTTGIISLTNIKATYKQNPNGTELSGENVTGDSVMVASEMGETSNHEVGVYMTPGAAMLTLRSLNAPAEDEIPEPSVPETTEPEETVPEEPVSVRLQSAVDAAKMLREKDYTQKSFKALTTALKSAEKVLKDKKATEAKIEAALEALNAAIAALEVKPDTEALQTAVDTAKKLKEKDYTAASYKVVANARKAAEKVLKDKNANQEKVDAALETLNAAVAALEAKPDTTELQAAVNAAKKLKEKNYTVVSYKEVTTVRKAAEKVLKDKNATQATVDAALETLNDAVEALEARANTTALKSAVNAAKKLKEKNYTKESFQAVTTTRKAAEKLMKDKNATQAMADEALAALNEAMDALVAKPGKK